MALHSIKTTQRIPVDQQTAWRFFSDPGNLERITPADMQFRIISQQHETAIYPGQIIEYKLRPLPWLPVNWVTEITHVSDERLFVDEQRFGPYAFWHHQHHFTAIPGGTEMTDIVHYKIPLGFLGSWVNTLFVQERLKGIFEFRYRQVERILGSWHNSSTAVHRP